MTEKEQSDLEAEVISLRAELTAAKSQLLRAHQMSALGQLLASIVHEINTPIGSILSNNEVVSRSLQTLHDLLEKARSEGGQPSPKTTNILKVLLTLSAVDKIACERIIAVVRGLKNFVGGHSSGFIRADINDILDKTMKLAHCEYRHRIEVETDYGDIPEVVCDPHQLGQVFLNLLVNAGHAIEGKGKVVVRSEFDGDAVHVSIADNGAGIPLENRNRIFSTGFTTKASGVGTGLGLAISKDIVVDGHGGTIDFESEVGKGTTFHIRVPVCAHTD